MFDVLLFGELVGTLTARGRGVRFTYAPGALENLELPPISLSLPKRQEPYADSAAGPFFRNLLPEQAYRRLVTAAIGTAPENDLVLLGVIGGECPGAVSIWPETKRPAAPPAYRTLDGAEVAGLFSRADRQTLAGALVRGRLSLAGAQEKIALLRDAEGRWQLPLNGAVTSHILKQSATEFPDVLENELFCMALAEAADLVVASVGIIAPDVRVFCTERFDRIASGDSLAKLHQEDFCQVLAVDPGRKYEHDGGPGIKRCAAVISRHAAAPVVDLERLIRWAGFNYLVGNEDAHAKNLALLYERGGALLSPHYDVVSTEIYPGLRRRMAMKIGRAWDVRNVQAGDFKRLAAQVDLPWPAVRTALGDLADRVATVLSETKERSAAMHGPSPVCYRPPNTTPNAARNLSRSPRGAPGNNPERLSGGEAFSERTCTQKPSVARACQRSVPMNACAVASVTSSATAGANQFW